MRYPVLSPVKWHEARCFPKTVSLLSIYHLNSEELNKFLLAWFSLFSHRRHRNTFDMAEHVRRLMKNKNVLTQFISFSVWCHQEYAEMQVCPAVLFWLEQHLLKCKCYLKVICWWKPVFCQTLISWLFDKAAAMQLYGTKKAIKDGWSTHLICIYYTTSKENKSQGLLLIQLN